MYVVVVVGCATHEDPGVRHNIIVVLQVSPTLISVAGGMHIDVERKYLLPLRGLLYSGN